jgi:DNA-binding MarR family transcriptional regulator
MDVHQAEDTRGGAAGSGAEPAAGFVDDYLLYLLARASHQASRQFHAVVKARGLQVPEWRVLATLADGPRTIGTLADITLIQQPTLTKVVDRMAASGLVCRRRDGGDRRKVVVMATETGQATVADLLVSAREHENAVLSGYSNGEASALKAALRTLIERTAEADT